MINLNKDRGTIVRQEHRAEPAQQSLPRRTFVLRTLLATGVGTVGATVAAELVNATSFEPGPEVDPIQAEIDARMALIVARHGARLDESSRISIRKEVEALVKRGRTLRAVTLTNADEPAPAFQAYRAAGE